MSYPHPPRPQHPPPHARLGRFTGIAVALADLLVLGIAVLQVDRQPSIPTTPLGKFFANKPIEATARHLDP